MPPKKKPKDREPDIDEFNRFWLQYTDNKWEPFFKMEWTQVVMNYACAFSADYVTTSYRNYLKK